ncbi:MAG: transposase [Elusimicrobiota bacterium]|jgi:REP element-mobilizing transposase RayT
MYHVLNRGNAHQDIFICDEDFQTFLDLLGDAAVRHDFSIHAYALMPNHYHIQIEAKRGELADGMRRIDGRYAQYFNKRHQRVGHVFQGRYKSLLIDKNSYYLTAHRYIHQNPVKAGLVRRPWDYEWSSCREFVGLRKSPQWLEVGTALARFDGDPDGYAQFVSASTQENLEQMAKGRWFVGSEEFAAEIRDRIGRPAKLSREYPFQEQIMERPDSEAVLRAIAACGCGAARGGRRELEIFLLREESRLSLRVIADRYGLSPSGISRSVARTALRLGNSDELAGWAGRVRAHLGAEGRSKVKI